MARFNLHTVAKALRMKMRFASGFVIRRLSTKSNGDIGNPLPRNDARIAKLALAGTVVGCFCSSVIIDKIYTTQNIQNLGLVRGSEIALLGTEECVELVESAMKAELRKKSWLFNNITIRRLKSTDIRDSKSNVHLYICSPADVDLDGVLPYNLNDLPLNIKKEQVVIEMKSSDQQHQQQQLLQCEKKWKTIQLRKTELKPIDVSYICKTDIPINPNWTYYIPFVFLCMTCYLQLYGASMTIWHVFTGTKIVTKT